MIRKALLCALVCLCTTASTAQERSAGKAAALSVLIPGLGHRYLHGGRWGAAGSAFVLAEASLWLGLVGAEWQRGQAVQSYRTLATSRAGAHVEGKNRRYFINLGAYASSDAFVEDHLLRRRWDQISYVSDPAYQWHWASEQDRKTYSRLRGQSDAWARRRAVFVSTLAVNRLLAALTSILAVRRRDAAAISLSLPPGARWPDVRISWTL